MILLTSVDMGKQLYYSKIHSKNIKIYLSKLYNGTNYEVDDVIKYIHTKDILSVNNINSGCITNYITCASIYFVQRSHKFINTFRLLGRKRKIPKDEKKHYGTVDESSSEQQFRKSGMITFVV